MAIYPAPTDRKSIGEGWVLLLSRLTRHKGKYGRNHLDFSATGPGGHGPNVGVTGGASRGDSKESIPQVAGGPADPQPVDCLPSIPRAGRQRQW